MIKKNLPLISSLFCLGIIYLFWDQIKLPYEIDNKIFGEYYIKKYNPKNDVLRFIFFVVLPIIVYFFLYLKFEKNTFSLKKKNKHFFLNKKKIIEDNSLDIYFYFFLTIIFIEFISLDFNKFIGDIDIFHLGAYLVPPINYLNSEKFFETTFYDYGFIANNIGLIYHFFFNNFTIGSIYFTFFVFIFLTKFALILICKKICSLLNYNKNIKIIFFCFFTFIAINLPNYYDLLSYFSPRSFLYLMCVYFLGSELIKDKDSNYSFLLLGFFSVLTLLWWVDIGAYYNILILFTLIYLLIFKKFKNFIIIIFSLIGFWLILKSLFTANEFNEFWLQLKLLYSDSYEYLLGIEYKKPFAEKSARWTKALLLIYISSLLLINFNFSKALSIDGRLKIFLNFFFISGILIFKSALMRSDGPHIKYSSGIYTLVFLFLIFFFLFNFLISKKLFLENFKKYKFLNLFQVLLISFILFFSLGIFNTKSKIEIKKIFLNTFNFKNNITNLITANDKSFLDSKTSAALKKYEILSEEDECIQILTDDISFSYFLKKKTCTKFFIPAQIIIGVTEEKFINELQIASPKIILYKSNNEVLTNKLNMPNVIKYVNSNYSFLENYNGYIFFKINNK